LLAHYIAQEGGGKDGEIDLAFEFFLRALLRPVKYTKVWEEEDFPG
jgi:hypothetical protein